MKVLFVYPNSTKSREVPLGIAYLSGSLKRHGYETGLLDLTWKPSLEAIVETMKGYDLLAVSGGTLEYSLSIRVARIWKKRYGLPVVVGGPHATVVPEEVIKESCVDAICVGEGEEALVELVEAYEETGDLPGDVKNFWVNKDGQILRNPLRRLVEDLDTLPFPDRSIFDISHVHGQYGCSFLTSRGCPFRCSMCINHYLQRLYEGLGKYTRFRSIDNLFEEIEEVIALYKPSKLLFSDDTFTINQKRVEEFCRRYPKQIGLPFFIMGRCNTVTKRMLANLRKAGCIQIGYGVEAGNPFIRNKILRRGMSSSQIEESFKWTREVGIRTASFNMIGTPFEDRNRIFDTVKLNRLIKPDVVQVTMMYPFPKTDIHKVASRHNMIDRNPQFTDYYSGTIIKLPTLTRHDLYALRTIIPFYVRLPRLFHPLIRLAEASLAICSRLSNRLVAILRLAFRVFTTKFLESRKETV